MNKTSRTRALFLAGAIGLAGAAQADAIFYPDGTMVDLGENGAETLALDSTPSIDTSVLGGPAADVTTTTTTTVVPSTSYVYVQPNIHFDRHAVVSQLRHGHAASGTHVMGNRHAAAATFDVPARAGEASTMTGGAPNVVTDNQAFVVGSRHIPYSAITVGEPYYVMSF
ncbi:hypothetical protein [Ramlibacter pallidus]|uniref:Uncharacterized protein n=1 Tax=Ramlibacter pallidus TaxID=2780087 RepID=A0ABR9RZ23_9BURK|nr:hypothetical protein [Ramlibacter pallidus]MBE7366490.1 hypothetical protein [Ramlibacter pallidus]